MLTKRNSMSPFNIICKSFYEEIKPFTYQRLVDFGECYYYLRGTSLDYVSTSVITRYENEDHHTFKSRFDHFGETEKVCIERLEVAPPFENKGIMTIMFCDIMLALLTRSLANENHIEIKFINTSDLIKDGEIVNVYHSVMPKYKLSLAQPSSSRIVLEGRRTKANIDFYQDVYYIFPLETRAEDIAYYTKLRERKMQLLNEKLKEL
ncbi:hypothetical protein ACQ23P_09040 [Staphylococcus cohnii]|uniref:hypothetical protein n=1 Tax=Staphylococcus TaxID=1279 RepID=UPI000D1C8DD2|nr:MULTISPECIES: hypothetical protein [Staphylococcus]MBA1353074.1 hypothetical protein [Staphylococcus cohnii]MBA1390521.1 hypothetical protein [Staphylococcus cohnii]MCE5033446.1 hypothetical protein [Staphylococcus cohnii]PTE78546.1 hypothetical protein BUY38_06735 [Staphylococcus cohnii]PTF21258.1 hypothetical protein BUY40_03360 [Staphylococcus cohnii]